MQNVSIHFDGAMVAERGSHDRANRIAVVAKTIDSRNEEKIVAVPKTMDGSGLGEATCVNEVLERANIKSGIKSMCFDTTSSNTSRNVGACKYLEEFIQHPVLYCACRSWTVRIEINSKYIT